MDAIRSTATIKIIESGIDDPDFADKLSRLTGDHDVATTSTFHSDSGKIHLRLHAAGTAPPGRDRIPRPHLHVPPSVPRGPCAPTLNVD
jgi:hypothetical protein